MITEDPNFSFLHAERFPLSMHINTDVLLENKVTDGNNNNNNYNFTRTILTEVKKKKKNPDKTD